MVKKLAIAMVLAIGSVLIGIITYLLLLFAGNFVIDEKKLIMNVATSIVDEEGNVIAKLYDENRELVRGSEIPDHVKQAFIAIEDERFLRHHGVDVKAILRALYRDMLAGEKVEGGSTITQQLAKRAFLSDEKTFFRKTKEVMIAFNLERKYSKEKILEMYLNQIYFGHGAYGIEAAAHRFFQKSASELTVEEGALLAGLAKAPSAYSPIDHPDKSKARRDLVLSQMADQGYLTHEEAVRLQGKTLALHVQEMEKNPAYATYIDMVLDEAEDVYHLSNEEILRGGYRIVVPMDRDAQQTAFELFRDVRFFPGSDRNDLPEGALVAMNGKTGGVIAAIGGREYVPKGFNRVTAKRQPGSAFKPLAVYAPALETGNYHPYSLLEDKPHSYDGYKPKNADGKYRGEISLYDALVHSSNAPAVWLFDKLGVSNVKESLKRLGFSVKDQDLKIALGGIDEGVSPWMMMKAYRAFLANGKVMEPYVISKIYDQHGKRIGQANRREQPVFSPQTAWYMTKMLEAVVGEGTAKGGRLKTALAGKTGTTGYEGVKGGNRDAWFVGFTPQLVGAVWIGYDKTDRRHYLTGGSRYAANLMKEFVNRVSAPGAVAFEKPEGVEDLETPIRLVDIRDLRGGFTFKFGLPAIRLSWTPSDDDRVVYRIYSLAENEKKLVAEVIGKGEYTINWLSFFADETFVVVPFNPQTNREGNPSNRFDIDALAQLFQ